MTFEEAMSIMEPLMRAMAQFHERGVIHRDIKPSNIMLCKGVPCLIDFGISRRILEATTLSGDMSERSVVPRSSYTRGYGAPEQIIGEAGETELVDVYGVAATLYRMVTGVIPDDAEARLRHDLLQAPLDIGARVTKRQSDLIMQGLALQTLDRFQNMQVFLDRLNESRQEDSRKRENEGRRKKGILQGLLIPAGLFLGVVIIFLATRKWIPSVPDTSAQTKEGVGDVTGTQTDTEDSTDITGVPESPEVAALPSLSIIDAAGNSLFEMEEGYQGRSLGSRLFYDQMMEQVLEDLETVYGMDEEQAIAYTSSHALTVCSTIDPEVQERMDRAVSMCLDSASGLEAAAVMTDLKSGAVLAVNGGSMEDGIDRAATETEQPGSLFMIPAVYAPAFDRYGYTDISTASNKEYVTGRDTLVHNWDNSTSEKETYRYGIVNSLQCVAGHALRQLNEEHTVDIGRGAENSYSFLQELGFTTLTEYDCSEELAMGSLLKGVTLLETNTAFSVILGNGTLRAPKYYFRVEDQDGNVILDSFDSSADVYTGSIRQVMQEESCRRLQNVLQDTVENGTAAAVRISGKEVVAKTGASGFNRDVWVSGSMEGFLLSTWAGYRNDGSLYDLKLKNAKIVWKTIMEGQ